MWRAMIVDDEPIIRFGIKASVDWAGEGIEIVSDCANGAEALRLLEESPVDILITDIKMPVLDGLALSKQALERNPGLKVVLVSSYNDFEYVREGLKLGVADYILKHTLEPEELLQVIRRCKDLLERENHRLTDGRPSSGTEDRASMRKRYEGELKIHLLKRSGRIPDGGYPEWLNGEFIGLVLILNRVFWIEEQEGYLHKSVLFEQMTETLYEQAQEGIAIQTAENEMFFLLARPPKNAVWEEDSYALRMKGLAEKLESDNGITVTIGYAAGEGADSIRTVYTQGKTASDRGFFEGSGIYAYEPDSDIRRDGLRLPELFHALADASDEKVSTLLAAWREDWSRGGCPPLHLKEEASRVLSNLFKHQVDPYTLVESFDRLFKAETLGELCETLQSCMAELRRARSDSFDAMSTTHPIDKALDYIRSHYLETMTLQQVADYVHVSKNYFSILFKKVTGENFIDYVIKLRVQRAKELLAGSELKVYEVAEQSGFNDVKYFSKLFKKITGYSPVDYREQKLHLGSGGAAEGGGS